LESFKPAAVLARRAAQFESIEQRLPAAMRQSLAQTRLRLDAALRHLTVVGPKSVLGRGFSYTLREDGHLVRTPRDVEPGGQITTVLADGEGRSVVGGAREGKPPRPAVAPPAPA